MKTTEIDLALPFEQLLAKVFSLPLGCANVRIEPFDDEAGFKQVIRGLYEAANGRQVETPLGFIAIAPPVAPFLKAQPFQVATRIDLLVEAATRIIGGPALCECEDFRAEMPRPAHRDEWRHASFPHQEGVSQPISKGRARGADNQIASPASLTAYIYD
ncbi:MAG: hypothetical protein ABI992_03320 [Chthoniobacterales bacterium]